MQGAFLYYISHITNKIQSIDRWEDMVIWASECGLTGIDINLLCQEYRHNYTLLFNAWKVAASCIQPESNSRGDVIKWMRDYKIKVERKDEVRKSPEEIIKELDELI
jgi:hypothetical protein